jgi:hypothetical protein
MAAIKELGLKIDEFYKARASRLEAKRKIKEAKELEYRLKQELLDILEEAGLQKASGMVATASIKRSVVPVVEDWDLLHEYVATHNRFDLLQKRISTLAWRDMFQAQELVPGTAAIEDVDLSLTKASR